MSKKSDETKKYSTLSHLFLGISLIMTFVPILVYVIIGFINGEVHEKVTLGISFMVAVILLAINLIFKYHIRSILWILVLGIYFCLDNILPLLLVIAISTILDEFVFSPLHKHYAAKAKINKEIDKRIT